MGGANVFADHLPTVSLYRIQCLSCNARFSCVQYDCVNKQCKSMRILLHLLLLGKYVTVPSFRVLGRQSSPYRDCEKEISSSGPPSPSDTKHFLYSSLSEIPILTLMMILLFAGVISLVPTVVLSGTPLYNILHFFVMVTVAAVSQLYYLSDYHCSCAM